MVKTRFWAFHVCVKWHKMCQETPQNLFPGQSRPLTLSGIVHSHTSLQWICGRKKTPLATFLYSKKRNGCYMVVDSNRGITLIAVSSRSFRNPWQSEDKHVSSQSEQWLLHKTFHFFLDNSTIREIDRGLSLKFDLKHSLENVDTVSPGP